MSMNFFKIDRFLNKFSHTTIKFYTKFDIFMKNRIIVQ